ncbi:hypothetical protein B0T25DRAFT_565001 [Lasiosphaeria hispida]|uniref:Uncharacterized protein n=1 Tax=Lasiosphaeria hispida TaxID=260671 RepID=A0AAJ0MII3_9PEZI|nr:hypothetical protein B0T25DRAFT_565001 [Lasiosphaeria hispida]
MTDQQSGFADYGQPATEESSIETDNSENPLLNSFVDKWSARLASLNDPQTNGVAVNSHSVAHGHASGSGEDTNQQSGRVGSGPGDGSYWWSEDSEDRKRTAEHEYHCGVANELLAEHDRLDVERQRLEAERDRQIAKSARLQAMGIQQSGWAEDTESVRGAAYDDPGFYEVPLRESDDSSQGDDGRMSDGETSESNFGDDEREDE